MNLGMHPELTTDKLPINIATHWSFITDPPPNLGSIQSSAAIFAAMSTGRNATNRRTPSTGLTERSSRLPAHINQGTGADREANRRRARRSVRVYLTAVDEIRAEGVPASVSEARILEKIELAEEYIERRCKWWFEARALTLKLNGTARPYLYMPAPIVSITSVTVAEPYSAFAINAISLDELSIFNRVPWLNGVDDRWNPKLVFKPAPQAALLIQGDLTTRRLPVWTEGVQNVTIQGTFGFIDQDGLAPLAVRTACRRLVIRELRLLADHEVDDAKRAKLITQETTDSHSYTLENAGFSAGALGDPEIDRPLWRYTKPNFIGSTA
jgi:hypothetical protein